MASLFSLRAAVAAAVGGIYRGLAGTGQRKAALPRTPAHAGLEPLEARQLFNVGAFTVTFPTGTVPLPGQHTETISIQRGTTANSATGSITINIPSTGVAYASDQGLSIKVNSDSYVNALASLIAGGTFTVTTGSIGTYTYGASNRIKVLPADKTGSGSGNSSEPPVPGDHAVVGFEDGTDFDYNDWYVPVIESEAKPGGCNCGESQGPLTYNDGTIDMSQTDLTSTLGPGFSVTRSWTNSTDAAFANNQSGNGMILGPLPTLVQAGTSIQVLTGGISSRWFDAATGGGYTADFGSTDALAATGTGSSSEYDLTDAQGNATRFYGFDSSIPAAQRGQFKSYSQVGGSSTTASYDTSGRLTSVLSQDTVNGMTAYEQFTYSFVTSGVNAGKVASIAQEVSTDGVTYSVIRSVNYTFYDGTSANGNAGDLQTAVVSDSSGNVISTDYYRYYTPTTIAAGGKGYVGGLRYYFNNADYARVSTAVGSPLTASDASIAPYAMNYFEYDSNHEAVTENLQGTGAAGVGTFTYARTLSGNAAGFNTWDMKTVESLPNGTTNTVYTNAYSEPILKVYTDSTGKQWASFTAYDANGDAILSAQPSAVSLPASLSTLEQYPDLLHQTGTSAAGYPVYQYLSSNSGLISLTDFYTTTTATATTAGGAALYVKDSKIEQGETGTPILQSSQDYFAVTVGGVAIFPTADSTQYRNADGTGAETASFNYTYFSGTVQQQSMTTSLPVISSAQNGSGSANVSTQVNDADGRVIFSRDAAGFITYNAYDPTTGAMVKTIQDLDTTNTSDYDASSLPAGWATPAGGGLNLVTTYVVDALGRTVKETSPAGRVTYTTYDDANHEIRVYPGWHQDPASGLWTTTGPVQVNRDDLANNYSETLTYAHTPVSGVTAPTGGDAIANLQGLSRTLMDSAGRTIETDAYFNLSGISYSTTPYLGSVNVNYYATLYGFDVEGNQNRVQSPTGTITRTVYDGQNRAVSTWVGTNDTPASGAWSPTNNTGSSNMSLVSSRVYDNGGVGDGNVTSTTVYPGGPAAPRTTQSLFDWRDRQISSKSGETSALPSGWTDGDIGSPAKAGSASFDGAVWTVTGGGADVYGTADQLNLASQSLSGNGVVIAQVLSQTNTSAFAKAGVMVRGSSAADAAEASVFLTPSGVEFDYRATAGGSTSHTTNIAVGSTVWVKLARIGNTFLAYYSSDGKTWKPVGTAQTVTMTGSVLVGLAVSARNNSAASTATFQNVSVLASPALPAGWSDADINAPALAGSALFDGASFIVSGGGADIYGAADQFNFASQSLTGNTTLIARLGGQTNTSSFAKAGLMVRSSSAANAAEATVLNTPSGVAFQWRATAGGTTSQTTGSVVTNPWLKLVRSGNSFTAYYSTNGTTWTQIGSTQAVTMTGAVLAGLAVSAHNNSAISTAEFDNVSVNGTAVGGAPTLITDGTHRPITVQTLDNLGEATATRAYDGDTVLMTDSNADGVPDSLDATKLIAYDTAAFDEQGRTYQQSTYSVTPGTGAIGNATTTNVFADSRGNTIATYASGQGASKATFDGAGRETETFTTDGGAVNNSGAPLLDYADASGVTNDVVVSQTKNVLDADSNPIETISSDRLPGDSVSATGALGDASGTGGPAARVSYAANFFDAANRPSASENVGTNGGSAWTRPSSPDSSDATHLVSSMTYNSQGLEATSTDPRGIVNATFYNLLGETTETIAAYTGGTPTSSTDQTTTFTYNGNGNETSQTAVMPSGTPNQTTAWVYGVTTSTGSTINSNDLLAKVEYPSATTGAASTSASDDVSYTFDARGETTSMTDQNSTTHSFGFDSLGRPISDAVTILGSGVDGTVQLHTTSYNSRGNVYQMTAYASPTGGAVINQTQDIYNGLGQLTGEYQSNSGAVITASTPETQYTYSDPTAGSLMTSLVYPNGRVLNYGYSNNALDSAIGRVDYLADAGGSASGHLVDYLYLGAGTIVQQSDANGVALSYLQQVGDTSAITDAGDSVTGLNRFGQVSDQNYVNTSTGVSTDRFQYGFDQNSNVLYSNNLVNSSESQLYHANSATSGDNSTAYDPLNRLTGFARGTLVASGNNGSTLDTVNSPGTTQSWSLDAVGNQSSVTTNGTTTTNTTNAKNEMTANGSAGLTFDNNGNTTTDQAGNTYTFDAWNHIATAKNSGGTTIATYTYAANGDRITKAASGTTTGFYYNGPQIIEQRQGSTVTSQNVFNIDYVNDLLLTDNNSTSGDLGLTGSGLGQRLFAQHDANFNVTALADATGTVVERYMYDPYGNVTVLQPDGTTRGGGTLASSHFGVPNLFQGMRVDSVTGLYQTPNRDYSPVLGRWMEADRGFVDGPSLYQFVRSNPVRRADPTGWASFKIGTTPPANPYNAEMAAYKAQYNSWSVYGALVWIVQEKALIAANVAGGSLAGYPHAADGLAHFLENTGTPFDIDLPSFITEDPNAKKHRDSDIDAAMSFIEAHVITSKDIVQADNTTLNSTTPDWNSTLGQTSWYASATGITRDVSVSPNRFSMTFNISLRDYYKWVLGSLKTGGWKLVDGDLAKLNAYGVAQDYPQYGTYQVYVEWCAGQRVATGAKLREPFHIF